MLIFADRLLFEATEEDDTPATESIDPADIDWESPESMSQYMSQMTNQLHARLEPQEADMNVLFLARLNPEQQQELMNKAAETARSEAQTIAAAIGHELGPLRKIDRYDHLRINKHTFREGPAFVSEIPYGSEYEIISFGPRQVAFEAHLNVSYEIGQTT